MADRHVPHSYWVKVSSMALTLPTAKSSKSYSLPGGNFIADLDSGTSQILLPPGLAAKVCADLNGTTLPDSGNSCTCDCALRSQPGGLSFGLKGKTIDVTYENLISEFDFGGGKSCTVDIADSGIVSNPPTYILGGESSCPHLAPGRGVHGNF